MTNIYSNLTEAFPQEMARSITKSGTSLVYIPVSEVINRLNKVLGVDKWSFTILRCERDAIDPEFVVAHVRIDWYQTDFACVSRDGFGGQKIKRNKQGGIVDLGDEFKGAISDALKKAAQTLGVGLYLARSEDAIEIEQVMEAEHAAASEPPNPAQTIWENFMSISKGLSKEQKEQLRTSWSQWSKGQPAPNKDSVTVEQATFLVTEATRLSFSGATVIEAPAQ